MTFNFLKILVGISSVTKQVKLDKITAEGLHINLYQFATRRINVTKIKFTAEELKLIDTGLKYNFPCKQINREHTIKDSEFHVFSTKTANSHAKILNDS